MTAGLIVYLNSFYGQFIFDDHIRIVDNLRIRDLSNFWELLSRSRPVAYVSFALNYAQGKLNPWGYHMTNLIVHLLAGLTLFGIIRRTLLSERLRDRHGRIASGLALTVSLIWIVHPLQTQSVTYIIQRCESMMGLFYLLTIYCVIRGASGSDHRLRWYAGAVASCALGMGSKAVMVTAPVVVLLYDRTFLGGTFKQALRRRWQLYLGLCATWSVLAYTGVITGVLNPKPSLKTVGLGIQGSTPFEYALTQPGIILHYLRLSIWPHPLCLDYLWQVARTPDEIVFPMILVGLLLAATVWALLRHPVPGFLGASFFIILSPTSSVIPIQDAAFEHRMYLPLAVLVSLVAIMVWRALDFFRLRLSLSFSSQRIVGIALVGVVVASLGIKTLLRNRDYHDAGTMWRNVLTTRPYNPRAYFGLGRHSVRKERYEDAIRQFTQAIRLAPEYAEAHFNLGVVFHKQKRADDAIASYREALRIRPTMLVALSNLGGTLQQEGELDEAIVYYRKAIKINPRFPNAHANYGNALLEKDELEKAIKHLKEALHLNPELPQPRKDLAMALVMQNKLNEALSHWAIVEQTHPDDIRAYASLGNALLEREAFTESVAVFEKTVRLRPDWPAAHNDLGVALSHLGRFEEAIAQYNEAIRLNPDFKGAQENLKLTRHKQMQALGLGRASKAQRSPPDPNAKTAYEYGNLMGSQNQTDDAIEAYRKALRIDPNYVEARVNLGVMLARARQIDQAITEYQTALSMDPNHAPAHYNLGNAMSILGRRDEAMLTYREALRSDPNHVEARINLGGLLLQSGQLDEAATEYRKVLEIAPRNITALCNLATALARAGNTDGSITELRRALEIDPDHKTARRMLDTLLKKQKNTKE